MRGRGVVRGFGTALAVLAWLLATSACAPPEPPAEEGKLHVVTTIGMIRDVAEHVGGDHVRVTGLMGPGVDPHLYKASEGDVRRLFRADVIFYRSEEHTSELQSRQYLVCRLLLEKKNRLSQST